MNGLVSWQVRGSHRLPRLTFLLCTLALSVAWLSGFASSALVLDLHAYQGLSWWRWLTAHWVHSDAEHLFWNVSALLVLGMLFERRIKGMYVPVILLSSLMIDIWFVLANQYYSAYCGLSGNLNAILALGLAIYWKESRDSMALWILFATVVKIGIEWVTGDALFTRTAWEAVPQAHLIGLTVGLFVGMFANDFAWQYKKVNAGIVT